LLVIIKPQFLPVVMLQLRTLLKRQRHSRWQPSDLVLQLQLHLRVKQQQPILEIIPVA
jgi:hypothetical protein